MEDLKMMAEKILDEMIEIKHHLQEHDLKIEKLQKERALKPSGRRRLKELIDDEKYAYIFGWKVNPKNGKVSRCSRSESENLWARFRRNVTIPIFLHTGTADGSTANFNFTPKPHEDMSDTEYAVYTDAMLKIIDIIYNAKKQLEVINHD